MQKKLRYVIFGTGAYFFNKFAQIKSLVKVVALLDNNEQKHGTKLRGLYIFTPNKVFCKNNCLAINDKHGKTIYFDKILLLAGNKIARNMYTQLETLGIVQNCVTNNCANSPVQFYDEFLASMHKNLYKDFAPVMPKKAKKSICLISTHLDYNGGTLAICDAYSALNNYDYNVTLVVPSANYNLVKELVAKNIHVIVFPALEALNEQTIKFFDQFDVIIVNVLQMIDCVVKLSAHKKVVWWLHEPSDAFCSIYSSTFARYPEYRNCTFNNVAIYAVSNIAKRNFLQYFNNAPCGILPLCIQDYYKPSVYHIKNKQKPLTIALIGGISKNKAQFDALCALERVQQKYANAVQLLFVGNCGNSPYAQQVLQKAKQNKAVKLLGECTQKKVRSLYKYTIDVILCPSYEETLSIVSAEGFMNCKTCIVSKETGVAQYIEHGVNGLLCNAGDITSIASCIEWCIQNRKQLAYIGKNARTIYDANFTPKALQDKLTGIIEKL